MEIKIDFNIGENVHIKPLDLDGRVTAVTVTSDGTEIKCKYYSSSESKYDWFFEDELEHVKEKNVGFADQVS